MRKPNAHCVICQKELYRRPNEIKKYRFVSCKSCVGDASKLYGITEAQETALKLGRTDNHLTGIPKTENHKRNISRINTEFYKQNPQVAVVRGLKSRGAAHYRWNPSQRNLNKFIRGMKEFSDWREAIKIRDKNCKKCGGVENLEAHHIKPLHDIIVEKKIECRDQVRNISELWDIKNGILLCMQCHDMEHKS